MAGAEDGVSTVWVFHGDGAKFASAVSRLRDEGLAWGAAHRVTGVLTEYPVGRGAYDDAVERRRFTPSKPHHGSPSHVARFSPSGDHVHLVDGQPDV